MGRFVARLLAITRSSGRTRIGIPSISRAQAAGVFDFEAVETVSREHDVHAVQALAAKPWGLNTEPWQPEASRVCRRRSDRVAARVVEPEIEILGAHWGTFEHGGAQADQHEPDLTDMERLEQGLLSGREREVVHD